MLGDLRLCVQLPEENTLGVANTEKSSWKLVSDEVLL
jgi:hypothetical protein